MTKIFAPEEIGEVIEMLVFQDLDIRAVTLGLNLQGCASPDAGSLIECVERVIREHASMLSDVVDSVAGKYGVKIVTKRIAVTPASILLEPITRQKPNEAPHAALALAKTLDKVARGNGIDYVGGFAAFVHKGFTPGDEAVINAIPEALASTETLSAMINVASTMTGINSDAVLMASEKILETSKATPKGLGCARLVIMGNAPEDNPFMPGAYHGLGEPELTVNVAVSGPGVIEAAIRKAGPNADLRALHDIIKRTAFKITRLGELIGKEVAKELGATFGIVDLSPAPSPKVGDSVATALEALGLEVAGAPGTIAALYLLIDAVKKGGAMATSSIGGLSGAFIPVSEDWGMSRAAEAGAITIDRLEAMMTVCNTGVDMVAIPGDTPKEIIAGIILDVMAAAIALDKALGVRLIPVPGAKPGDKIELGGLLGETVVISVPNYSPRKFVERGGLIPPPTNRLNKG